MAPGVWPLLGSMPFLCGPHPARDPGSRRRRPMKGGGPGARPEPTGLIDSTSARRHATRCRGAGRCGARSVSGLNITLFPASGRSCRCSTASRRRRGAIGAVNTSSSPGEADRTQHRRAGLGLGFPRAHFPCRPVARCPARRRRQRVPRLDDAALGWARRSCRSSMSSRRGPLRLRTNLRKRFRERSRAREGSAGAMRSAAGLIHCTPTGMAGHGDMPLDEKLLRPASGCRTSSTCRSRRRC
jgi:hypothetical protein